MLCQLVTLYIVIGAENGMHIGPLVVWYIVFGVQSLGSSKCLCKRALLLYTHTHTQTHTHKHTHTQTHTHKHTHTNTHTHTQTHTHTHTQTHTHTHTLSPVSIGADV